MGAVVPSPSVRSREMHSAWGRILADIVPMQSIEIARECPLRGPERYAYGDTHLGGGVTLGEQSYLRGDARVEGVLR